MQMLLRLSPFLLNCEATFIKGSGPAYRCALLIDSSTQRLGEVQMLRSQALSPVLSPIRPS